MDTATRRPPGAAGAVPPICSPASASRTSATAALVQDLGRLGIPNSIWDKPAPLNAGEWERVRLHPYYTSRMLARSEPLDELGKWAASHHERLDGSGYHRGVRGSTLSGPERILAARPIPSRRCPNNAPTVRRWIRSVAAGELRGVAQEGRLLWVGEAVRSVLAAGGEKARRRPSWPAGLSDREVEVLRCAARGMLNRETARQLVISERTVAHHLQHVYDKIGVSTRRGAAALFAMENDLL